MIVGVTYLTVLLTTAAGSLAHSSLHNTCRCTVGQECWPTPSDFRSLSSEVSQPLIHPVPLASPCYPVSDPSGNCTEAHLSWYDGTWRSNHSGAMHVPNWETFTDTNGTIEACYLNTTLGFPCNQGNVPIIGVDARTSEDVQAAVTFASKHNLRLVIKNTGHDFIGRSTAKGSFMIWTHNMKNITFHEKFSPDGCEPSVVFENALTLQSGVQWHEAYAAASAHNRTIVGGTSQHGSVGSDGGWVAGGGHGFVSPNYGLGIDNVLQMTIVTADGSHLTVNEYKYPDLFWALRGGGGGTWGVLTSVTYRTHPNTQFSACFFIATLAESSTNPNATQNLFAELIRMTPPLVEQGYGGYSLIGRSVFNLVVASPYATLAEVNETFHPFFEYAAIQAETGGLEIQNSTASFDSFDPVLSAFVGHLDQTGTVVGVNYELSSWLLPDDVITNDPESLAAKLIDLPSFGYFLVVGGAVAGVDPDSAGINPAWRKALAYTVAGISWADGTSSSEIDALRANFKVSMAKWESIAPDSGAYLNEGSPYEFDWKKSFFGSHYDKLKNIKDKYDPQGLFVVWEGVGSDDWDASLNCPARNLFLDINTDSRNYLYENGDD